MHAAGNTGRENRSVILRIDIVFIPGVSHFMDSGEDGGNQIVLQIFCRRAAVILAGPAGKRMFRFVLIAPGRFKTKVGEQNFIRPFLLPCGSAGTGKKCFVNRLRTDNLLNQRNEAFLQTAEEIVIELPVRAGLIVIQHLIIKRHGRVPVAVQFFLPFDHAHQMRFKDRIVFLCLGFEPCVIGCGHCLFKGNVFFLRDGKDLTDFLFVGFRFLADVRINFRIVFQFRKYRKDRRVCLNGKQLAGKECGAFITKRRAGRRRYRKLVDIDDAECHIIGRDPEFPVFILFQGILQCHKKPPYTK